MSQPALDRILDGLVISPVFDEEAKAVVFEGDCLDLLRTIPDQTIQLVVTSPPYNIGKEYEKRVHLEKYVEQQRRVITECVRVLRHRGSICWQVGRHVWNRSIVKHRFVSNPERVSI